MPKLQKTLSESKTMSKFMKTVLKLQKMMLELSKQPKAITKLLENGFKTHKMIRIQVNTPKLCQIIKK